ncbi:MAG TPA: alpha/beta hydrolase [Candidatus Limnocylindrales bacterium]|jgi:pimeloyl-ACP methyl ester carboxylesterase
MSATGRDGSVVLADGRTLEYWDGGDPGGRPMIYQPGTPVSRVFGRWGHEAAVDAGVRLIALNRPGYGGSTTSDGVPSLLSVGRDTAELAAILGLDGFAVFGSSGGGPFATATAIAAPDAVRALGVVGGIGPWRLVDPPEANREDRVCLALLDEGDAKGCWACLAVDVRRSQVSPTQAADNLLATDASPLARDPAYRDLWIENWAIVQENVDGYIADNIAWGGPWDVDPRDVVAPTLLLFGSVDAHCSAEVHGRWYADRIAGSELVVVPTEGHFDAIDGHWPEVLAGLLRIWRAPK